jgi:hypothetical protein
VVGTPPATAAFTYPAVLRPQVVVTVYRTALFENGLDAKPLDRR